jgi:hypothetical protein
MESILQTGLLNKESAPSGAQLNALAAFAAVEPKWLAGIADGFATLRPGNVQPQAQVQTTRRATSPHPGCLGADCHPVTRLSVDDYATTPQSAVFKLT